MVVARREVDGRRARGAETRERIRAAAWDPAAHRGRLAGATYEEIAARGGGIVKTVTATRAVTLKDLTQLIRARLDRALVLGTTSAEVKSGYGLSVAAERTSLEAITAAAVGHPVRVVSPTNTHIVTAVRSKRS